MGLPADGLRGADSCLSGGGRRYFDEIALDTGKYCFGVKDTLTSMDMGCDSILQSSSSTMNRCSS